MKLINRSLPILLILCLLTGMVSTAPAMAEEVTSGQPITETTEYLNNPGNYYLGGDIQLTNTIKINASGVFNLYLNGHALKGPVREAVIEFYNLSAELHIYDTGGGQITHRNGESGYGIFLDKGTCHMYGGSITGNNDYGVYTIGGEFALYAGASITGNKNSGVYIKGGTFTMDGGEISNNTAKQSGGGIAIFSGSLIIKGGKISGNTTGESVSHYGGGVCMSGSPSFTMTGGEISGNSSTGLGGGVYASGTVNLSGSPVIKENTGNKGTGEGKTQNVYGGQYNITENLSDNASIGVMMSGSARSGYPIANGNGCTLTDNDAARFFYDDGSFAIKRDGNRLILSDSVTLTLNVNDGDPLNTVTKGVTPGGLYNGFLPTPTWTGHTFDGWFTEAEGGTKVEGNSTVPARDHALYAHWTLIHSHSYQWKYNDTDHWEECANAGYPESRKNTAAHTWDAGTVTTQPTCEATGVRSKTCTVCGQTTTVTEAALGHAYTYCLQGTDTIQETCSNGCGHSATAKIVSGQSSYPYDGSEHKAGLQFSTNWQGPRPAESTIQYSGSTTNVGSVTARITIKEIEIQTGYRITQRPVKFTIAKEEMVYVDSARTVTVTPDTPLLTNKDYTVSFRQNGASVQPKEAGAYDVMVYITNGNFKHQDSDARTWKVGTLTITRAPRTIQAPTADRTTTTTVTLNVVSPALGRGDGTVQYAYNTTNTAPADGWQTELKFSDLNYNTTYYFFARVTEGKNYQSCTSEGQPIKTNDRTKLPISVSKRDAVYDGDPHKGFTGTPSASGFPVTLDYRYTGKTQGGADYNSADAPTNAGSYTLTVSISNDDKNYTGSTSVQFTIAQRPVTVSAGTAEVSRTYDGSTDPGTLSGALKVEGILSTDTGVRVTSGNVPAYGGRDAGSYTVRLPVNLTDPTKNYRLANAAVDVPAGISPKTVRLDWGNVSGLTYSGSEQKPTVKVRESDLCTRNGAKDTCTVTFKVEADRSVISTSALRSGTSIDHGSYLATATGLGNDNYTLPEDPTQKYTIAKAAPEAGHFKFTAPGGSLIYDGQDRKATVEAKDGIVGMGDVSVKYTGARVGASAAPTAADTYTVTISVAEGKNYLKTTADLGNGWTFTIQPRTIGLSWSNDTGLVYTGLDQRPRAEATGLVDGESCPVTVAAAKTGSALSEGGKSINYGSYTATAEISNPNYALPTAKTRDYQIAKATLTVRANDHAITYE